MDAGRDEVVSQGMHLDDRRHAGRIAVVEGVGPLGQGGATGWFGA